MDGWTDTESNFVLPHEISLLMNACVDPYHSLHVCIPVAIELRAKNYTHPWSMNDNLMRGNSGSLWVCSDFLFSSFSEENRTSNLHKHPSYFG